MPNVHSGTVDLVITGTTLRPITGLALVGPRHHLPGILTHDGERFSAEFALLTSRWGSSELPAPSGDYRLEITIAGEWHPTARARVSAELPAEHWSPLLRAAARADEGTLIVRVGAPLRDDERGASAQKRLLRDYRRRAAVPENAVFFESFYAQTAACNPLAIDRELARVRPDITRYWSVVDRSIAVPPGAVPIVEGSAEWWRVRADARLLVVNDWLRKRWVAREHQTVLQTWHGTMLKRLALDRDSVGLRTRIAVRRESRRWGALLAQNDYAATIFRRAYAFSGPVWIEGYPRNDVLHHGDRARVRATLGLRDDQRAVLYAPTWRDDRSEIVDYLDLPGFAASLVELPGEHVVLVRGHSRTLRYGRDLESPGLLDVTTYPDMADLLLAADVLVTDYSSVMFDATTTEIPVILFTPDLERYRRELRGFYFDVTAEAPGPVVETRDALRAAIAATSNGASGLGPGTSAGDPEPDPRRAAWRARFNTNDDGHASERVVARILAEGMLT